MPLILVVDDEEYIRTLAKEVLELEGHVVVTSGSAKEALQLCQKRSFDLLVTDVQMPTMTGLELTRALQDARINVPILVISGTHSGRSLRAAASHGALGSLSKPFTVAELLGAVNKILGSAPRSTYICENCGGKIVYQAYKGKQADSVPVSACPVCGKAVPELGGVKVVAYFKKAAKGGKSG
jgi:two-component system, chemotaxis family, chemotaxis protein CheY